MKLKDFFSNMTSWHKCSDALQTNTKTIECEGFETDYFDATKVWILNRVNMGPGGMCFTGYEIIEIDRERNDPSDYRIIAVGVRMWDAMNMISARNTLVGISKK